MPVRPTVTLRMRLRVALLVAALGVGLAACGGNSVSDRGTDAPAPEPPTAADAGMQHIHGLGVSGDTLYIATHTGLWTAAEGQTKARRFGSSRQDVMGFSVVADERFLGSGHPAPEQTDQPPNLGLLESRDGGRNWNNVSLLGDADFHILETAGRQVYGVNSSTGLLMTSSDAGRNWQERTPPAGVFSLAIDPRAPQRLLTSTERGLFSSANAGRSWRPVRTDAGGLLAWPTRQQLYLVDGNGAVYVSSDDGRRWDTVGDIGGQPAAFIAHQGDLYAALADGTVKRSRDGGASWTVRVTP